MKIDKIDSEGINRMKEMETLAYLFINLSESLLFANKILWFTTFTTFLLLQLIICEKSTCIYF